MSPVKALGRKGVFGKSLNNFEGRAELQDDVNGHWVAKNHKHERSIIIEDLQDLAIDKSMRITILRYVVARGRGPRCQSRRLTCSLLWRQRQRRHGCGGPVLLEPQAGPREA